MKKETRSQAIEKELALVKGNKEILKPEHVLAWAERNKNSVLHSCFEWNDAKAAKEFRLWQARKLISLHIVTEGGQRKTVALVVDRKDGGGYRNIEDVVRKPELRERMLEDALKELLRVKAKYEHLQELSGVFKEIGKLERRMEKSHAA